MFHLPYIATFLLESLNPSHFMKSTMYPDTTFLPHSNFASSVAEIIVALDLYLTHFPTQVPSIYISIFVPTNICIRSYNFSRNQR